MIFSAVKQPWNWSGEAVSNENHGKERWNNYNWPWMYFLIAGQVFKSTLIMTVIAVSLLKFPWRDVVFLYLYLYGRAEFQFLFFKNGNGASNSPTLFHLIDNRCFKQSRNHQTSFISYSSSHSHLQVFSSKTSGSSQTNRTSQTQSQSSLS
jgi:hypothetical protein